MTPDGENRVYYAPIRVPGHEGDLAITLGYANPETGEIVEADVILNSKSRFALLDPPPPKETSGGSTGHHEADDGHDAAKSHAPHAPAPSSTTTSPPTCTDQYDFRSVVTHEAGHFFGLGEDMTDASATMYYSTFPCDLGKRDLKADDASEVASLYQASAESPEEEPASAQKCSVSLGRTGAGSPLRLVVAAGSAASVLRRLRRRHSAFGSAIS